uniref:Putative secreted protein n=1 Tax=Amblyomma cajennense TaxID=34607 RepID=A0A023FBT5_AMBCJ
MFKLAASIFLPQGSCADCAVVCCGERNFVRQETSWELQRVNLTMLCTSRAACEHVLCTPTGSGLTQYLVFHTFVGAPSIRHMHNTGIHDHVILTAQITWCVVYYLLPE